MNVNAILNLKGRNVITVSSRDQVEQVLQILVKNRIGSVIAVDEGELCGIVSERDIVRAIAERGEAILHVPVAQIMTREVKTCRGSDTIHEIMEFMTAGRFRHMPVVEEGQLVGIISIGDVVQRRIQLAELEADSMRSYIATG